MSRSPAVTARDTKSQRVFFDKLAEKLGIKSLEGWYGVRASQLHEPGLSGLLTHHYHGSLCKALLHLYPEHEWMVWRFPQVPKGFWNERNEREMFSWLGEELGVSGVEGWFSVPRETLLEKGGKLLKRFDDSLFRMVSAMYPEHVWDPSQFNRWPGIWVEKKYQERYLNWVSKELGVCSPTDWQNVTPKQIEEKGGAGLLQQYNGSLFQALASVYPGHKWDLWKFGKAPNGYWEASDNQKVFFEGVATKLGVKELEDWYSVDPMDVKQEGVSVFTQQFGGSLATALQAIYPNHTWHPWKFKQNLPKGYWENNANVKRFLEWVSKELKMADLSGWYFVTNTKLAQLGGANLVSKSGGLLPMLRKCYPSHKWDPSEMQSKGKSFLQHTLRQLFGDEAVKVDFKSPELVYPKSKRRMELHAIVAGLSLAFDYQGHEHFEHKYMSEEPSSAAKRDRERAEVCRMANITLVPVPHWWDMQEPSLIATILKHRPDLAAKHLDPKRAGEPIPEAPPRKAKTRDRKSDAIE